jgi:hypothetical protein
VIIALVWFCLISFYKLFINFDSVWGLKWVLDCLVEAIPMIIFTASVILFTPDMPIREGYEHHLEDNSMEQSGHKNVEMGS